MTVHIPRINPLRARGRALPGMFYLFSEVADATAVSTATPHRLDALQAPYWQLALDGDTKAVQIVLKIILLRMRMLGLDRVADRNDSGPVLIVDGSSRPPVGRFRPVTAPQRTVPVTFEIEGAKNLLPRT